VEQPYHTPVIVFVHLRKRLPVHSLPACSHQHICEITYWNYLFAREYTVPNRSPFEEGLGRINYYDLHPLALERKSMYTVHGPAGSEAREQALPDPWKQ